MTAKITLARADFDALPHWPYEPLPLRIAGNRWKYKVGPRWRISGYEDVDGIPMIVFWDEVVIEDKADQ